METGLHRMRHDRRRIAVLPRRSPLLAVLLTLALPGATAAQMCIGSGAPDTKAEYVTAGYRSTEQSNGWGVGTGVRVNEFIGAEGWYHRDYVEGAQAHFSTLSMEVSIRISPYSAGPCIVAGMGRQWTRPDGGSSMFEVTSLPVGAAAGGRIPVAETVSIIVSGALLHRFDRMDDRTTPAVRDSWWVGRGSVGLAGRRGGIEVHSQQLLGEGREHGPSFEFLVRVWEPRAR